MSRHTRRAHHSRRTSERVRNRSYTTHYQVDRDGELVVVKTPRKQSSFSITTKDVTSHGDDGGADTDDNAYNNVVVNSDNVTSVCKKGYDVEDWMPKFERKYRDAHNDTDISNNCQTSHDTSCIFTFDKDAKSSIDRLCYFLDNNDYANDNINPGGNTINVGCFNVVTYFSRKRKSSDIIRSYEKHRGSWRKIHFSVYDLPAWKNKKRRVSHQKERRRNNGVSATEHEKSGSCIEPPWRKLLKAAEGSECSKSRAMLQALEESQSLNTVIPPPQPSSPPVFLTTVLEGLPKELAESEPTEALHEALSDYPSSLATTDGTLLRQMEKGRLLNLQNEGSEKLTQKVKRKKHRPKVLLDIFDKAKYLSKSGKKQTAEQGKDGLLKDNKTKLRKTLHATKEQSSGESAIKRKKRYKHKHGGTLIAKNHTILNESNLSTFTLSTLGEGNSIVPFESNHQTYSQDSSKIELTLRYTIMKEVLNAQSLVFPPLYSREELCNDRSIATYVADGGQVRLSQVLLKNIQANCTAFQSPQQQLLSPLDANNSPLSLDFFKETGRFLRMQSQPEGSSDQLVLSQEPNNQLKMVAYDQRREMIISKSTVSSKFKAKVQLDIENEKIWPLLASGGIPKKIEDARYWQREREIMERQVEAFICTMRSIQGDRQFTPWKGSVLDSLVGAFLTQNVSDHLSSSAFMSIASRYPFKQEDELAKSKDIFTTDGASDMDSTHASESSRLPRVVQTNTRDKIEDQLKVQAEINLHNIINQEGTGLASLRAIKKALRNTTTNYNNGILMRRATVTPIKPHGEENEDKSDGLDRSTLQEVRTPEQPTPDTSLEGQIKVDINPSICRSLFENHNFKQDKGKQKRRSQSGVERAHLEENHNGRKTNHTKDWEALRKFTLQSCSGHESASQVDLKQDTYQDSVNWDAVRRASVEQLAATIKERGMHHVLSGRIKAFLKTIYEEQGNLDLEWLRKVSPEDAKAYLTAVRGLGVKSVECIRLLTLHHAAFPVDVNVGRILIRLGWVPIEPLPEDLDLHSLEEYPVQEAIQKYLWPRLCSLDQKTLYELHYHLITFGKVFCTKNKPNCNACPMRHICKHFASAYPSSKLLLNGTNDELFKSLLDILTKAAANMDKEPMVKGLEDKTLSCPQILEVDCDSTDSCLMFEHYYIEEPSSPEATQDSDIGDIEDFPCTYRSLNDFSKNLPQGSSGTFKTSVAEAFEGDSEINDIQKCSMIDCDKSSHNSNTQEKINLQETFSDPLRELSLGYTSNTFSEKNASTNHSKHWQGTSMSIEASKTDIVSLQGAYIPAPRLKSVNRHRTIHYVYMLPDTHPLLEQADVRETDDPSSYLLAIWSPGEAPSSLQGLDKDDSLRFSLADPHEMVKGTLLIPCRTAMRGNFPLNGTYFQVNEVFADHASSLEPLEVPRSYLWSLERRFVYFGTSVSNIFKGLTLEEIRSCFLRGHVCVRGFDRTKRVPRPLVCRLHFPISKLIQRPKRYEEGSFSGDKEEIQLN
ncbi:hypothetical protein L7F22_063824 [Adiantum nelumboides]|nr:hypothetical protein [Adiantum nelumboides]